MNLLHKSSNRSAFGYLPVIWLVGCASLGVWLIAGGRDVTRGPSRQNSSGTLGITEQGGARYRRIEEIRVGQRVVTPGTDGVRPGATTVDPTTWKLVTLRLANRWPDGTFDEMHVRTVQSPEWFVENHVQTGVKVAAPLDLQEMGVPNQSAEVVSIEPCPSIENAPGRVVLTTVNHLNNYLFELTVHGERGPPQTLRVTGWHKLYSETRERWVSVCELQSGERLRGRDETLTVYTLTRQPGTFTVYNMTVEGEHVYFVSALDLLAHNTDCTKTFQTYTKPNLNGGKPYSGRTSGTGTPKQNIAARDRNHHMDEQGFGPAKLDKSSPNADAIRGREQQLIENNGGARSQGGTSGNQNNGICPTNPKRDQYIDARKKEFGS